MRAQRDKADAKSRCSLSVRQASFTCSRVGAEVSQEIAPPADPLLDWFSRAPCTGVQRSAFILTWPECSNGPRPSRVIAETSVTRWEVRVRAPFSLSAGLEERRVVQSCPTGGTLVSRWLVGCVLVVITAHRVTLRVCICARCSCHPVTRLQFPRPVHTHIHTRVVSLSISAAKFVLSRGVPCTEQPTVGVRV